MIESKKGSDGFYVFYCFVLHFTEFDIFWGSSTGMIEAYLLSWICEATLEGMLDIILSKRCHGLFAMYILIERRDSCFIGSIPGKSDEVEPEVHLDSCPEFEVFSSAPLMGVILTKIAGTWCHQSGV